MTWLRRQFESVGLTQHPVGKHLSKVQDRFGGSVILCLDVSGSMSGSPLTQAVVGCRRFIEEAHEAHYKVGLVFWNHAVESHVEVTKETKPLLALLQRARATGGTNILPTLALAEQELAGREGDRVVAIFGDGDLGNARKAADAAQRLRAQDIRIITCGLGISSAESLGAIADEEELNVAANDTISESIAAMAGGLKRRNR
jgi:Mg-chelatase subunit ChlD